MEFIVLSTALSRSSIASSILPILRTSRLCPSALGARDEDLASAPAPACFCCICFALLRVIDRYLGCTMGSSSIVERERNTRRAFTADCVDDWISFQRLLSVSSIILRSLSTSEPEPELEP